MDSSSVWQRRLVHGLRLQKGSVPFPESVRIGLEFNAALERKQKLDRSLLTNAVMTEICSFAKTVSKSEKFFLFELLDFNFQLGVDLEDGQQCYAFALRVYNKAKLLRDQIRTKTSRRMETFTLPDPHQPGTESFPSWSRWKDVSLLTRRQQKASVLQQRPGIRSQRKAFPLCTELGVSLMFTPNQTAKQKLDPSLLTNGAMQELLDFSRQLCGKQTDITFDLVKQNFGVELDKAWFHMRFNKMVERRNACSSAEDREAFSKEPFRFQPDRKGTKRKKPGDEQQVEVLRSRRRRWRRRWSSSSEASEGGEDGDESYMCPMDSEEEQLDAMDGLSGAETSSSSSEEVRQQQEEEEEEEEEEEVSIPASEGIDEVLNSESEQQQQDVSVSPTDGLDESEKQQLWQRRADRSQKILSSGRVNELFSCCRRVGLDFNIGSGRRQNLDLQLFTNGVLWDVYKFGYAMKKSLRHFLFEILQNNFHLHLQDEILERNFIFYLVTKERMLQSRPDRHNTEFLSRPFRFPRVYNVVSAEPAQQQLQQVQHPFCQQIGLSLWSCEERRAEQKLDVGVLTWGAVMEMFGFVRQLCGNIHDTVSDVLEHNFPLDLQSGQMELIQRWFLSQQSLVKKQRSSQVTRWLNMAVPLTHNQNQHPDPPDPQLHLKPVDGGRQQETRVYRVCQEIGLDLDLSRRSAAKQKLDLQLLTRAVLLELHRYVEHHCNRYVPALFEILEYNFDLSSQSHRRVEFAWSIASQVIAMAAKHGRTDAYLHQVFQLPFEGGDGPQDDCKDEPEDEFTHVEDGDDADVMFVCKLKPVDIEVEVE